MATGKRSVKDAFLASPVTPFQNKGKFVYLITIREKKSRTDKENNAEHGKSQEL